MKTIAAYDFNGKKALIRVDFNVPLDEEYKITDTTRIDAAVPTIEKILGDGGAAILMSHLGRPKTGPEEKYSLKHLLGYLSEKLEREVAFAEDCVGEETEKKAAGLKPGDVLLLENLRFHDGEKKGDRDFAAGLSRLGDVYVNDAFGTAHRAHASTAVVAEFFPGDKVFGYLMAGEIEKIGRVLEKPERPFTAVLGGAKVSGKIEVIRNLLGKVDNLLIGGGMMFTFIRAMGGRTGKSLVEEDLIDVAGETMRMAEERGVQLMVPTDAVIADDFKNDAQRKTVEADDIPGGWMGLDIGPQTVRRYEKVLKDSGTILWNGPMGVFEFGNFEEGTVSIARTIAKATDGGAFSLIGGGDSVAAVNKYGLGDRISHISTGGGAMLEYIEGKQLPGVKAIED
ncbi:MAG: phosphoglycerate kinase [Bacteroidales bacterium]